MAYCNYIYLYVAVDNRIDNAILTDSDSPEITSPFQFLTDGRGFTARDSIFVRMRLISWLDNNSSSFRADLAKLIE